MRGMRRRVMTTGTDAPCCMGEIEPGFGCCHNIQFAGVSAVVRAEHSARVATVKTVRQ